MAITYTNALTQIFTYKFSWTGSHVGGGGNNMAFWHSSLGVGDSIMFTGRANVSSQHGETVLQGAFHNLEFNVNIPFVGVDYTYVWEYYGTREGVKAWYPLSVTDNTDGFQNSGTNTLEFIPPTDWYFLIDGSFVVTPIRIRCTGITSVTAVGSQHPTIDVLKGQNIIRVTGTENFDDIYDADVSGGWGVVTRSGFIEPEIDGQSDYPDYFVYYVNAWLAVGDGSTATLLTKTYGYIYSYRAIIILNNATFEVGEDGGDGFGSRPPVNLAIWDFSCRRAWALADTGGTFKMWGGVLTVGNWLQSFGAVEFKETSMVCRFGGFQFYTDDTVMRRVTVMNPADGLRAYGGSDLSDVTIVSGVEGFWFGHNDGVSDATYNRLKITKAATYQLLPVGYSPGGNSLFLDDCDIEDEASMYKYNSPEITIAFRHTWSALVRDQDGDPMENVTVVCKNKNGDTEFTALTNVFGETGEQKIVRKTVHYASGATGTAQQNATTTLFNPFEFTFSKAGELDVVIKNVTLSGGSTDPLRWDVLFGFP